MSLALGKNGESRVELGERRERSLIGIEEETSKLEIKFQTLKNLCAPIFGQAPIC